MKGCLKVGGILTDTLWPPPAATDTPLPLPPTNTPVPVVVEAIQPEERSAPTIPALPDASLSDCPCDQGDTLNCRDFAPFDAQSCHLRCLQLVGQDVHGLDRDSDGNACEWE